MSPAHRRALAALVALTVFASTTAAQQQPTSDQRLRQQREELERIRIERQELEERRSRLRNSVHDLREEVILLDRQADATARAMRSLESQLASMSTSVDEATANLVRAQDEQQVKTAVLQRRVADIYKRGPLYTAQALLTASSFGDLVARYKYLHLVARRDRALLQRVEVLKEQIEGQHNALVRLRGAMQESRTQKEEEERRLRTLRAERGKSLTETSAEAKRTDARLARIARDELRLASVISTLENARLRAEARPNATAPAASSIRTTDLGKLDWPVDGEIIYSFGRVVNPNNTTTRWNGIGIRASEGTSVRSVSAGQVMIAEAIGTYGLTVIVQHGGGDYSVYGSLQRIDVRKGQTVAKGQVIGGVGVSDPELPPHLHFEIRPQGRAADPLGWLRGQR